MPAFKITIAGDSALNLVFADSISAETSTLIRQASERLAKKPIPGVVELVPTFCSMMVCYDPLKTSAEELAATLHERLHGLGKVQATAKRVVHIPVCYGGDFGPDLPTVAEHAGLSAEEVVRIHSGADYLIDMLGFLPGFAYLGGLDPRLHTPRLAVPRTRIEAGSVGIGGAQTGVYPLPSPGGWQIIGRTPLRPYDPERKEPFLYHAGDYLRFEPISAHEYDAIAAQLAAGSYEVTITVEGA